MANQKINPVSWFEIYVEDMARAKKFYEEVLQTELSPLSMPGVTDYEMELFPRDMIRPGAAGALVKTSEFGPQQGGTIIHFESDDCSEEESRIEAAGGKILKPKESIGEYGFGMLALDSEGNTIGFHSMA